MYVLGEGAQLMQDTVDHDQICVFYAEMGNFFEGFVCRSNII